ncbi:CcdC protein domain-containing protein [Cohnella sp. REN36]|uniref:CcdC protein domain-containing protein n=1 Tax=Cohnella sp. REN36 TaxID=2887347 RepID=UPI001D14256F|nr:CcdC protein domain-containing protein [Cohnella sp. REN36]MCC3373032.1 DUF1453 family protein [Cohnella sp. REN36]
MHHLGQALIPSALILLLMYRRIRRTVGFQPYRPRRLRVRIGIFSAIGLLLLSLGFVHPVVLAADALGIACGGILAWFAVRHSRFETRNGELHYRTHIVIESIVIALLIGRLAYRFLFLASGFDAAASNDPAQAQQFARDPWTAGIFFVMVAYYVGYYVYVLRAGARR